MTLYEITGDYIALQDMLETLEQMEADKDADPKELEEQKQLVTDTLEGIKGELEAKAEGYIAVCNQLKAQQLVFKAEKDKWAAKEAVSKKSLERLERALFEAMVATGHDDKDGLDTGLHTLKIVNNGGIQPLKIDIPPEELPEIFQKVTVTADTDKIRGMLAKGEDVAKEYPWAHLEPRGRRLSIK